MQASTAFVGIASLVTASAFTGTAFAEPAGGESLIGSRIPTKPRDVDPARAGQVRKDFGRCMYSRYRAKADAVLLHSDPASVDLSAAGLDDKTIAREFSMGTCLGEALTHVPVEARMTFNYSQLRSLLAEEAYLAARINAPALAADATETVERTFVSTDSDLATARANADFADCVVFRDSAKADAVLRTMPGTTEERTAARSLAPTLGQCLTEGQTLELKAANIRVFVADGLWTRFVRPAGATRANIAGSKVTH